MRNHRSWNALALGIVAAGAIAATACNPILGNEAAVLEPDVDGDASTGEAGPMEAGVDATHPIDSSSPPPPPPAVDSGTDAGPACAADKKLCGAECVSIADPKNGCAESSCSSCPTNHSIAACAAGACAIGSCNQGWADCDSDPKNGCETDLSQPATCGSCGTKCEGGTPVCAPGGEDAGPSNYACASGCPAGAPTLCGATCANVTSDPNHCGTCATQCPSPAKGASTCGASGCGITCNPTYHACGATCADDNSVATCGTSCAAPCPVPANGQATCNGVSCGIACDTGYHLCSGACVANNSIASCGTTSCTTCAATANASPTCNGVSCGLQCAANYGNCDGVVSTGCEAALLSDPLNCGACGHSCLGGTCAAGVCGVVTLASGEAHPSELVVDSGSGGYVYWTNFLGSAPTFNVMRIPKDQSAPKAAIYNSVDAHDRPFALASDANYLYVGSANNADGNNGVIHRMGHDGSAVLTIGNYAGGGYDGPWGLAVNASSVYWVNRFEGANGRTIMTAPLASFGSPSLVYASAQTGSSYGITIDSTYVFWIDDSGVQRTTLAGAGHISLGGGAGSGIAVDATSVYWTTFGGSVFKSNKDGSGVATLATGQSGPSSIVVDSAAGYVYWTNFANAGAGQLMRVRTDGTALTTLAPNQVGASGIAMDATAIYWTAQFGGTVLKLAK